jgi:DNA invertase Pin-like site-specific DNA recombinase
MQLQDTQDAGGASRTQAISAPERTALLALLPSVGRERVAARARAAALYARVSTDHQDSIPAQLDAARAYVARHGLPVAYELEDTASGLDRTRADYQRLLALAENGAVSHIVMFKCDRLSRDDAEFVPTVRRLMNLGVEVHDTTAGQLTPDMVLMTAFVANIEVRNNSQRTTMKLAFVAKEGKKLGTPLIGYRRTLQPGVYEADPTTAPVISEMFARYAGGEGLRVLTSWLNARLGLPKPPPPGKKRGGGAKTPANVSKLLRNPTYKGVNVVGQRRNSKLDGSYAHPRKDWDFARSQSPALISPELWDRVQARLAQHQGVGQDRPHARYPFAGLVWCGTCQRRMAGHRNIREHVEYVCGTCGASRSARRVQAAVHEALGTVPLGSARIEEALARLADDDGAGVRAQLAQVEARLATLVQRKVTLTELYADHKIDSEAYQGTLGKAEAKSKTLRTQRSALEQRLEQTAAAQAGLAETAAWLRTLESWTALLGPATPDERRTIYRETIARSTLDPTAGVLHIVWTPQVARLCGQESCTVPLVARPRTRLAQPKIAASTIALIRELASAEPRPTARMIHEQLKERGISVSVRTVQRYAATTPARRGRPPFLSTPRPLGGAMTS